MQIFSKTTFLGRTDDDLKREKIPWVTHGSILRKRYHVYNMGRI